MRSSLSVALAAALLAFGGGAPRTSEGQGPGARTHVTAAVTVPPGIPPGFEARLLDLCDDEDAAAVLDAGELADERARLGVTCDSPRGIRYAGYAPGAGTPLFSTLQLDKANAWVAEQNAEIAASAFRPSPEDFFAGGTPDANGCRSRGLKRVPPSASNVTSTSGDVDGDGRTDRVLAYWLGDPAHDTDETHLRVELGSGRVMDVDTSSDTFDFIDGFYGPSDLDRNRRDEIWVEPNTNKPGAVAIFVFAGCELRTVTDGDDSFLIHTYPWRGDWTGIDCLPDRIVRTHSQRHVDDPHGTGGPDIDEGWSFRVVGLRGSEVIEIESGRGDDLDARPDRFNWTAGLRCP